MLVNGHLSDSFRIMASVPQGCALSPSLYLITCEPLLEYIRQDSQIRGLILPDGRELKVSGFADDLALYIADPDSLAAVKAALDLYCSASAASINHDKTVGIMLAGRDPWRQVHMRVDTWVKADQCERYLGVHLGSPDAIAAHWQGAVDKMNSRAAKWAARDLSIFGRSLVHKASVASILWYMCESMETPDWVQAEMVKISDVHVVEGRGASGPTQGGVHAPIHGGF